MRERERRGGRGGGTYLIVLEVSKEKVTLALRTIDAEPLRQVAEEQLAYLSATQHTLLHSLGRYLKGKELPSRLTIAECYDVYLCHMEGFGRVKVSRARVFDEIRRLGDDFHFLEITQAESLAPDDAIVTVLYDLDEVSRAITRLERAAAPAGHEEELVGEDERTDSATFGRVPHDPVSSTALRLRLEDAWQEVSETVDSAAALLSEEEKEELKNTAALALQAAQTGDERRFARAVGLLNAYIESWVTDILNTILAEVREAAFPRNEDG
jgi:hypothetical protein